MKMRVALLYWTHADDSEYGNIFPTAKEDEWHFPIDSQALLPVGSKVHLLDKKTNKGIDLAVTHWHFDLDDNLLKLQVVVSDECEATPKEFRRYIKKNWLFGNKIDAWAKMP